MAFDTTTQARPASPVKPGDVDLDAFAARPLSPGTLRCLRYQVAVERHTIRYLRDLLVTPSHTDPVVTEFLTSWAYDEYWLGETLDAVLAAHEVPPEQPDASQRLGLIRELKDRFAPIRQSLAANLIGTDFVAIHMSWETVNTWFTDTAYARIALQERHPELCALIDRVRAQKESHLRFYESQARSRLASSAKARKLTRFALGWLWVPAGQATEPAADTRFVLHYLFGGPDGVHDVQALDQRVDTLPGQAGLRLVSNTAARYGIGPAASPAARTVGN